jgi:3-deoxy-7-phosphoheptulonate synthase
MPTGFKNSTDGSVGIAIDACRAARAPHVFLSVGREGLSSIVETEVRSVVYDEFKNQADHILKGNPDVHVILRGGTKGPNYSAAHVAEYGEKINKAGLMPKIMVRPYYAISGWMPI